MSSVRIIPSTTALTLGSNYGAKMVDAPLAPLPKNRRRIISVVMMNSFRKLANVFAPNIPIPSAASFAEEERFEGLRKWRNDLAKAMGVRPFLIFSNRILRELARACPASEEALLEIRGIGKTKQTQYGDAVLAELKKFSRASP